MRNRTKFGLWLAGLAVLGICLFSSLKKPAARDKAVPPPAPATATVQDTAAPAPAPTAMPSNAESLKIVSFYWYKAGFDNVLAVMLTVRNKKSVDVKDIVVHCDGYAASAHAY